VPNFSEQKFEALENDTRPSWHCNAGILILSNAKIFAHLLASAQIHPSVSFKLNSLQD
jgi:hypothetical protein